MSHFRVLGFSRKNSSTLEQVLQNPGLVPGYIGSIIAAKHSMQHRILKKFDWIKQCSYSLSHKLLWALSTSDQAFLPSQFYIEANLSSLKQYIQDFLWNSWDTPPPPHTHALTNRDGSDLINKLFRVYNSSHMSWSKKFFLGLGALGAAPGGVPCRPC